MKSFIFSLPILVGNGFYYYPKLEEISTSPLTYLPQLLLTVLLPLILIPFITLYLYQKILFFKRLNTLRIMANFLIENNYYLSKTKKRAGQSQELITLPKVYIKRGKYQLLVSFILEVNKFQDSFINLGSTLEVMFKGDCRNKTFDNRFVQYEIAIDRIASRINVVTLQ